MVVATNVFITGTRDGNNPLLVARALQKGSLIPGKPMKGLRHSHVSFDVKSMKTGVLGFATPAWTRLSGSLQVQVTCPLVPCPS